jgi:hypothetical protein
MRMEVLMRAPTVAVPALLSAMLLAACGSSSDGTGPSPVDLQAVKGRIAAPTGTFDGATKADVVREGRRAARIGVALGRLVPYVVGKVKQAAAKMGAMEGAITAADAGSGSGSGSGSGFGRGSVTSAVEAFAWAKVACPGPDMASPSVDFSQGEVRVDAESAVEDLAGYWRLAITRCVVEADTLDGVAHSLIEDGAESVTVSGEIGDAIAGVGAIGTLHADALVAGGGVDVLIDLAGASFVVTPVQGGIAIRAANGRFECALGADGDDDGVACTPE